MDDIELDNLGDRPVEEKEEKKKQILIGGTKVLLLSGGLIQRYGKGLTKKKCRP